MPRIETYAEATEVTNDDLLPLVDDPAGTGVVKKLRADTLREYVGRNVFHVADYEAAGDGITDDAAAIQSAIDAAEAAGGGLVEFDPVTYAVASGLTVDNDHVLLACRAGAGMYLFNSTSSPLVAARLLYTGTTSTSTAVVTFTGSTLTRRLQGGGIVGLGIDCGPSANRAGIGLLVESVASARFVDVGIFRMGVAGLKTTTVSGWTAGTGDVQENVFDRFTVEAESNTDTATCLLLTHSEAGSNTSLNYFGTVAVRYAVGHGIDCDATDGNVFARVRGQRWSGAASGRCMIWRSSADLTDDYARNDTVVYVQPGAGGLEFEGGNTSTQKVPKDISVLAYSLENSGVEATWGSEARGVIRYTTGEIRMRGAPPTGASETTNDLFVVDSEGNVGIGVASPEAPVHIQRRPTANEPIVIYDSETGQSFTVNRVFNASAGPFALYVGESARGTRGSPAPVQSGDRLVRLVGRGHTGSAFSGNRGVVEVLATETFTGSAQGTRVALMTTKPGTTSLTERVSIDEHGIEVAGTVQVAVTTKTGAYTITDGDSVVLADATSAGFTVTLPTAVGATGRQYTVKKIDSSANAVTIDGDGTETIDGATTYSLATQWDTVVLVSDGSNWVVTGVV